MSDPSKRFLTVVLLLGAIVLITAVAIGNRMAERVLHQATERGESGVPNTIVTPTPEATAGGPMGPNWKKTQIMAAATDPAFPDPRVPPAPLPTRPTPAPAPTRGPRTPPPPPTPSPTPEVRRTPVVNPSFTVAPRPTLPPTAGPNGLPPGGPQPAETPVPGPTGSAIPP
jgi:Wiskott-Aldrich syndrome protein